MCIYDTGKLQPRHERLLHRESRFDIATLCTLPVFNNRFRLFPTALYTVGIAELSHNILPWQSSFTTIKLVLICSQDCLIRRVTLSKITTHVPVLVDLWE